MTDSSANVVGLIVTTIMDGIKFGFITLVTIVSCFRKIAEKIFTISDTIFK